MPQLLRLRELTAEEERAIGRLARSRTAPVRVVERARIIALARQGQRMPASAAAVGVSERTVRRWVKRFTAQGLAGLADGPRSGRPATYPPEAVGELIAASLTDPQALGLPFARWTLDRLAAYLHETKGIAMKRSRIGAILPAEGLRWRNQETGFGERPDPAGQRRARPAGDRRRAAWPRLHRRGLRPGPGGGPDRARRAAHHYQRRRRPGAGGGVARSHGGARLRRAGPSACPPRR